MRLLNRSTKIGAIAVLLTAFGLVLASTLISRSAADDKGILAGLFSRVLTTPTARVSIGEVDGALSSDATISNITVADRKGVWLRLDKVRLIWSRTALLLSQKLEVDKLEVGHLEILRRPLPSEQKVANADQPILPQLPVKVEIKEFSLKKLSLGEPVIGQAASLTASGNASLGDPSEGLKLQFDARRLDAPGSLTAHLALVPKTQALELKLAAQEPAGGLVVHALNVPNLPPVSLDLNGKGTLDSFAAQLKFDAGDGIGATGTANVQRVSDTRRLSLDLKARIAGLLPSPAAPIFAGTTQLNGTVDLADSGAVAIKPLTIRSQTARLDVQGTLSPLMLADLKISARALPNAGKKTAAGQVAIGKLVFDANVTGLIGRPQVKATVDAADVTTPQGGLSKLAARFATTPDPKSSDDALPFNAHVTASGLSLSNPAFDRALGSSLTLDIAGAWDKGVADLKTARVQTATADMEFIGRVGQPELNGRLTVKAQDLARFGALAGLKLRGALGLNAKLTGVPKDGQIEAALDGRASRFATGIDAIDGLAGGQLDLNGSVRKLPNGGFGFGGLRLTGRHVVLRADGEATAKNADIDMALNIPELRRADKRLTGRAEATLKLTGSVEHPNLAAAVTMTDGSALGRPIPRLSLTANASDVTGMLDAHAKLDGSVGGKPAQGTLHLAKLTTGGWRLDDVDVYVGSARAEGGVTLHFDNLADGKLTIDAGNLDDLSPLALTKLSGSLHAAATLSVANGGGQSGTLAAEGRNVRFGATALDRFAVNAKVADLYRHPVIDGDLTVGRARIGGEEISQIRFTSQGDPKESAFSLTARARGFAIDARGKLIPASPIRLELASLTATRSGHRIALLHPTALSFRDEGVAFKSLMLALDRGRLAINGRVGKSLDVSLHAQSVPLSVSEAVMPDLGLSGTLNAEAKIGGTTAAPTGNWHVRVSGLATKQTRDNGLPALDIAASGRLANRRSTLDATVRGKGVGTLNAHGTVPLAGDGLDLAVRGAIDLGAANTRLSASGRSLGGKASIDMRLRGSLTRPQVAGTATIAGGSYADAGLGVRLTKINGRLSARGDSIRIERLTAQSWDSGTLAVDGSVRVAPDAGFPGNIRVTSHNAKLVANSIVTAVANLSLTLSGPLARDPRISGRVDVVSMDITIPERLPTTLEPIPGTRHVNAPPEAEALLAMRAKAEARARGAPAFDAALDLAVSAPNHVFVRGRGIDAELGGDLRLKGRLADPVTVGAFELRRGRMSIAGTRLDFTDGRIAFVGSLIPNLDFTAQTQTSDSTITIKITGSATSPGFAFSSAPSLPPEEILSRLLFDKASGGLSPAQALQVAQVAALFSGGGGPDVFDRVRRALGVDSLDVSMGASGSPTVGVSRAINRRISVGVKTGTNVEDSGVSVDIDVTRHIRAQGEIDRNGGSAVGVGVQWEY